MTSYKPREGYWFSDRSGKLPHDDNREYAIGAKLSVKGKLVICENALHGSFDPFDALQYARGPMLHKVIFSGARIEERDKVGSRSRTIIASRDAEAMLRHFARRQALSVASKWDMPDVVRQYLETGNEDLRSAAESAARSAARSAESAYSAAASITWGALMAAKHARNAAAWSAASYARNAAVVSAESAARHARNSAESAESVARHVMNAAVVSAESAARHARNSAASAESARHARDAAESAESAARHARNSAASAESARHARDAAESAQTAAQSALSAAKQARNAAAWSAQSATQSAARKMFNEMVIELFSQPGV